MIIGFEEEVILYFLIAGHTKNVCDGSFGHVKRNLQRADVVTPSDMMKVIDESSVSNRRVPGSSICWFRWRDMLDMYFKIPSKLKISYYQVFSSKRSHPGTLFVRSLSTTTEQSFMMLKDPNVLPQASCLINTELPITMTPLLNVRSEKHGSRYNYLKTEILDCYYHNDHSLHVKYFMNGT